MVDPYWQARDTFVPMLDLHDGHDSCTYYEQGVDFMMSFGECCDLFLLLFGHNLVLDLDLFLTFNWHLLRSYFVEIT